MQLPLAKIKAAYVESCAKQYSLDYAMVSCKFGSHVFIFSEGYIFYGFFFCIRFHHHMLILSFHLYVFVFVIIFGILFILWFSGACLNHVFLFNFRFRLLKLHCNLGQKTCPHPRLGIISNSHFLTLKNSKPHL